MVNKARIKLTSTNKRSLEKLCNEIKDIAQKTGAKMKGPIPLPTKKLKVPTRKSPCGEGSISWDHYQLRIHKRLIDISASDRIMRSLMRLAIPSDVFIEITLK
ncbi:30S ribosomal protein S10 [Candidatus Bathyarchaeota archaeon]|nr:30S ribosomal protein S10 [Candidatus Bathyarchaeota archaeon]